MSNLTSRKIYVGGIQDQNDITHLSKRFLELGIEVLKSHPIFSKDGSFRNFTYLEVFCSDDQMHKIISIYNMKIWKGGRKLCIEPAKMNFMDRLRISNQYKVDEITTKEIKHFKSLLDTSKKHLKIKKPNGKFLYVSSKKKNSFKFTKFLNNGDAKLKYYYDSDLILYKDEDERLAKINFSFLFYPLKFIPVDFKLP